MTHFSLCSGIGGIDLAAEMAGFESCGVCEIDPKCRTVLARHFPSAIQHDDVKTLTGDAIRGACGGRPTILSAGFPCQPFSVAGKRTGSSDDRHLWPEIARLIREAKPRWFLGENVRGIFSISNGSIFGSVLSDLANLGYRVGWGCFGADEAAGAPHRRDRVFIVGYLADSRHGKQGEGRRDVSQMRRLQMEECKAKDGSSLPSGSCPNVAHPAGKRLQGSAAGWVQQSEPSSGCRAVANAGRKSDERPYRPTERPSGISHQFPPGPTDLGRWADLLIRRPDLAPALSREEEAQLAVRPITDGVSRRVALRMLGNAVIPAQVYPILKWIADFEGSS